MQRQNQTAYYYIIRDTLADDVIPAIAVYRKTSKLKSVHFNKNPGRRQLPTN